ncbi:zinc finger protein 235-like isoform X2 [Rhipicephalus sanguineus]|uniref:zinc finger protein 235-like isoform X2 n=1 Tax=Rhipicephalus sanguineus TaxID=34632 RepID=UPI0020C45023|nr:zinc finger protein 235-like isoform X2 [Rhipicephalus sanguineus]
MMIRLFGWTLIGDTDTTDNASIAFQPPMSSASVADSIPSTSHGVMQEAPELPGNDDRLCMPLSPTEMPEVAGTSLFKTTGGSNNISVPSTSSAPIEQHNARFLGLTKDVPLKAAHDTIATTSGHVDQLQSGSSDFLIPMDITGSSHTLPSARQESLVHEPGRYGNNARTSGATSNYHLNMEYHQADHPLSFNVPTYPTLAGSSGLSVPLSNSGACHSVPSTSRAGIEETMRAYDASAATGSTNWEQREDGVRGAVNHVTKPPRERHTCEICAKSFTWSSDLVRHRRIHTGEKPYRCDICGKLFTRSSALAPHRLTHSGEKPHVCDICEKSFTQKVNLVEHRRIHTGEKPYLCEICGKLFSNQSSFARHRRTH